MHTIFRKFPFFMALPFSLFIILLGFSSESEEKKMDKARILMSIFTLLTQTLVIFLYIKKDFYPYGWMVLFTLLCFPHRFIPKSYAIGQENGWPLVFVCAW